MFQNNSVLRRTCAPVDAAQRSGHRSVQLSGRLRRQMSDRPFTLPSATGSKPANRTI